MAGKWKPRFKEIYYAVGFSMILGSSVDECMYTPNSSPRDRYNTYFGNCFKTKKEAEAVLKKIRRGK